MNLRITGKKTKARAVQATKRAQQADRFLAASVDYGIYPGSQNYESCNKYAYRVKNTDSHKAAFWSFISMLYLTFCVALPFTLVHGAYAADVHGSKDGLATRAVITRALGIDSASSITDSTFSLTGNSTYLTPSASFLTETADATTVTASLTVTPFSSVLSTEGLSCLGGETVTVIVTTVTDNDAVTADPEFSGIATSSDSGVWVTVTLISVSTRTTTLTSSKTTRSKEHSTSLSASNEAGATSTTTKYVTASGLTDTITVTVVSDSPTSANDNSSTTVAYSLPTGTGMGTGIGTATASWTTMQPSTNGTFTYRVPSLVPSQPTAVTSWASGTYAGRHRHGGSNGGSSRGFYCVIMAAACAVAVLV
ncbi:hypothetical protein C7999DRAFT_29851 [Corynascus novoguineensis]|uniref:Uncharacterized protein n=1 Tax=Corynascus novoguineensis TaxID=1126955 RepID=A0AAN7HSN0_9PEZI|nr:hypothetical protein C7999DRAFT_29851 [Corynascus novoguineensis]